MLILRFIASDEEFLAPLKRGSKACIVVPDYLVKETVSKTIEKYNKSKAKDYIDEGSTIEVYENPPKDKFKLIYITQESVLTEFRLEVKRGNISAKEVVVIFRNKHAINAIYIDEGGYIIDWPDEFCKFIDAQLMELI